MLCGRFMETFVIQKMVTEALKQVSLQVFERRYGKQKISDEEQRMVKARYDLVLQRRAMPLLFTMAIDPKYVLKDFYYKNLIIFNSKKVPLLVKSRNQ